MFGGAVLLDASGAVVGVDHNRREELSDATAHAEILVISAWHGRSASGGSTATRWWSLSNSRDVRRRRGTGPPRSHRLWGC